MANCHFDQDNRPVPVAVITSLEGKILLSNNPFGDSPDKVPTDYKYRDGDWFISGCRVMITRFWACSTASVVLVPHLPNLNQLPNPLPSEIDIERQFCIWMGYIESCRPVVDIDLVKGRLLRVFVGIIDNVKSTASASGGYTIQLQARDRTKWFMDSEVYFNTQLYNKAQVLPRSQLLYDLANYAVGRVEGSYIDQSAGAQAGGQAGYACSACDQNIKTGENEYRIDPAIITGTGSAVAGGKLNITVPYAPADFWYTGIGSDGKQSITPPLAGNVNPSKLVVSDTPEFRIHTTRVDLNLSQADSPINFILNAKLPLEVMKTLAFQEVYPTELFQDSRDGNFYYGPRGNDYLGLLDPNRFNRVYYYKLAPANTNINQFLLALREERSSIGVKTNFIVSSASPLGEIKPHDNHLIHFHAQPYSFRGLKYGCKFIRISDPTIKSLGECALVAIAAARVWARETNVGMAVCLGDPSFVPGEIVQVLGSPLLEKGGHETAQKDLELFIQYSERWNRLAMKYAEAARFLADPANKGASYQDPSPEADILKIDDTEAQIKLHDGTIATIKGVGAGANELVDAFGLIMCELKSKLLNGENKPGFDLPPKTIFRIEAVHHKFSLGSRGYTSEIALVTAF